MQHASARALSRLSVCIAEDRATCEPALRILVASLARHCPGLGVHLFCPNATDAFRTWLTGFAQCVLNPWALDGARAKYDIKPLALLTLLEHGEEEVVWIDSDILVTRDFRPLLAATPLDTIAVAEEALVDGHQDPGGLRARLWNLPVGRELPFTLNTGIVRVGQAHRALLGAWHEALGTAAYREAQAAPWYERPPHLAGDQEVLTALLSSEQFAAIPILFLRRGRDIVQFFGSAGYTVAERLRHLRSGMPSFVHSLGFRPWWPVPPPRSGWSARFTYLYTALSPYTVLARDYADALEDPRWLAPPTLAARMLTTASPPLTGLPLALVADVLRLARGSTARVRGRLGRHRGGAGKAGDADAR